MLVGRLLDAAAEDFAVGDGEAQAAFEARDVGAASAAKQGEDDPVDRVQEVVVGVHGLAGFGVEDQARAEIPLGDDQDLSSQAGEDGVEDGVELGIVELLGGAAHVGRVPVGPAGGGEPLSRFGVDPPQETARPVVVLERAHHVPRVLLREVQGDALQEAAARRGSVLPEAHQTNSAATDGSGIAGSAARPENRVENRPASSASATAPLRAPEQAGTGASVPASSS